jgi:hypothetical protein
MKRFLLILLFGTLSCATANAQAIGGNMVNAQPQPLVIADHPQHASQTPLAPEQSLLEQSQSVWGHGERPLWEVMPPKPFVPIAEFARSFRQEHTRAKRAVIVWNDVD